MADLVLPSWIVPETEPNEPLDEASSVFRSSFAPGLAQRQSYGGLRNKFSRRHTVRAEEKAQLLSVLRATRGSYNVLRSKIHSITRGSFPDEEVLTNNTFASGTTGWGAQASTISVSDRILRILVNAQGQSPGSNRSSIAITQYAPYVFRSAIYPRVTNGASYGVFFSDGTLSANGYGTSTYSVATLVPNATTVSCYCGVINDSSASQGDWIDVSWTSLSRCAQVDNGINGLTRSDDFSNAAWNKNNCSAVVNAVDPEGTTTACTLTENATAGVVHRVNQTGFTVSSATTLDYCAYATVKAGTRTWCYVSLQHATGVATVWLNLATGALGLVSNGTSWTNTRGYVKSWGDGWYTVYIVSKKTSAATLIDVIIGMSTGDAVAAYNGDGVSTILLWRSGWAQSAVPMRPIQTVASASTGTSQTGSTLFVKGLPVSTNGLILPEDVFEVGGEAKQETWPLNSDGAGLGVMQFEAPLFRSPANDDPVIFCDPMAKFLVSNIKIDNEFGVQARVEYDLESIYE